MAGEVDLTYQDAQRAGFDQYARIAVSPARTALFESIELAHRLSLSLVEQDADTTFNRGREDGFLIAAGNVVQFALDQLGEEAQETRETFIATFEGGAEAFFPEGLTPPEKAQLYDTYVLATRRPDGRADVNQTIYEARAQIIERLIGKRFESLDAYHGINICDLFEVAGWLYGENDEAVGARGWTVDPIDVFKPNPGLLHVKPEALRAGAEELAGYSGVPIADILVQSHRGLYRYAQNPTAMQAEIDAHRDRGTIEQIRRRPDILNYPLAVLKKKEAAYTAMGIPLEAVRANGKFYVYRPERIQDRIDTLTSVIAGYDCLTEEDRTVLLERFITTPRLILDCGADKIKAIGALVSAHAQPEHWHQAMELLGQHRQGDTPQGAALFYLGRVSTTRLKTAMQANPDSNIFILARDLVNKPKAEQKRVRRARKKGNE